MLNCFVYFIDNGHEEIKIGKANRVEERRKQGETWSSKPLVELGRIFCDSPQQAFFLEWFLHEYFNSIRVNPDKEWFTKHPSLLEFINGYNGNHFNNIRPLIATFLHATIDTNKMRWAHVIDAHDIICAYVYEILESQQFIEAYGEHDRAMVQALMC